MKRNRSYREKSVKPVVHVGGAVGVGAGQWVWGRGSGDVGGLVSMWAEPSSLEVLGYSAI